MVKLVKVAKVARNSRIILCKKLTDNNFCIQISFNWLDSNFSLNPASEQIMVWAGGFENRFVAGQFSATGAYKQVQPLPEAMLKVPDKHKIEPSTVQSIQ